MTMASSTWSDAFDRYRELIDAEEATLTALDERSGDGDFGANLHGGLAGAAERSGGSRGVALWAEVADSFLNEVGGTSGPLFGLLFQAITRSAAGAGTMAHALSTGGQEGLAAIQRVGEAEVGDRTLVDALQPGVEMLLSGAGLAAAVDAAVDGAIATGDLIARRGRASYVGERAVGVPDPGAVGIALLFIAFGAADGTDTEAALARLRYAADVRRSDGDAPPSDAAFAASADGEATVARVADAHSAWSVLPREARARAMDDLSTSLHEHGAELVSIAYEETRLTRERLNGELERTAFQLRMFAGVVRDGGHLDACIDEADPDWPVAPRPDLRRINRPIGPVLVFAASNFPFAFSVLGGDTASALAAGNAVVVKTHSGHPRLSRRVAEIAAISLRRSGAPDDTLSIVESEAQGVAVLQDSRIKASAFTGSIAGGRALFDIAQGRRDPIPFFGELGSNNPAFVTTDADARDGADIARGFVASFTLGSGQFCTKPGTLFLPTGSRTLDELTTIPFPDGQPLLNSRILEGYQDGVSVLAAAPEVRVLRGALDAGTDAPAPTLLLTAGSAVLRDPARYLGEVFGPAALVVEYETEQQMLDLAAAFEGQLTATIFGTRTESPENLVDILSQRAGRVLWCQWPTGVAVTRAQQHGGPYPASTAPATTSVGSAAIHRFMRPIALQNFPERLLPEEVR